ncbi:lipoprotein [Spiroplasma cantharicola]|uniref:Lipoprotein n=1 Tax=Spiroplasma cantharicola TaxID=362837 RepID=A0A0M3SJ94_9MOLU|nr:lipoprotein [Spiroplasma cantharicola]ALD66358.1 hypothetical protein SCANT_v1c04520 [Spiroplasma cantharicola]
MRKLLSILGSIGLLASTGVTVTACNPKQEKLIIPAFPATVEEAQKIISDLSKPYALTKLEINKLKAKENSDNLTEILNLIIKNKFNEYESIIYASIFKIVELEGNESEIKIWEFDEDNMNVEEIEISINVYLKDSENDLFYSLEKNINSKTTFPNEVIGREKMINNLKDIRKWWLDGKNLEALSDQFRISEVSLKNQEVDEALEKVIRWSKNEHITIETIEFVSWLWPSNETESNSFAVRPKNNDKFLGLAMFEWSYI